MNPTVFHVQQAWIALTGAGMLCSGWCGQSKVRPTRASPPSAEKISVMQCLCVVLLSQKLQSAPAAQPCASQHPKVAKLRKIEETSEHPKGIVFFSPFFLFSSFFWSKLTRGCSHLIASPGQAEVPRSPQTPKFSSFPLLPTCLRSSIRNHSSLELWVLAEILIISHCLRLRSRAWIV